MQHQALLLSLAMHSRTRLTHESRARLASSVSRWWGAMLELVAEAEHRHGYTKPIVSARLLSRDDIGGRGAPDFRDTDDGVRFRNDGVRGQEYVGSKEQSESPGLVAIVIDARP